MVNSKLLRPIPETIYRRNTIYKLTEINTEANEMTISKKMMTGMRPDIENALKAVGEQYGVEFTLGSGKYSDETFSYKLKGSVVDPNTGNAISEEERDFTKYSTNYGLNPKLLGTIVTIHGKEYQITGLFIRSPKYPIRATKMQDGKSYKLPVDVIKSAIE